jgi:outer membrane autotransporter protein
VAAAVEALGTGPVFDAVVRGTAEQARRALDLLSGEIHAGAAAALLAEAGVLRSAINGRLRQGCRRGPAALQALAPSGQPLASGAEATTFGDAGPGRSALAASALAPPVPGACGFAAWGRALGSWGRLDGDGNAASVDHSTGGVVVGLDGTIDDTWWLGLAGGYTHTGFDMGSRRGSGDSDGYHVLAYGAAQLGPIVARLGAGGSWQELETTRRVDLGSVVDRLRAEYDAWTAQVFGEVAYPIALGPFGLEPFAGLAYVHMETERFGETGGPTALTVLSREHDLGYSTLGLRAARQVTRGGALNLTVRGALGWQHAFGDVTPTERLVFRAGGTPFTVAGAPVARDSAIAEAGLEVGVGANVAVGLGYEGRLAPSAYDHGVVGHLVVRF